MSKRNLINAKLFRESFSAQPESQLFSKGNTQEPTIYEHIGGKDDIFRVKHNGGTYDLSRQNLRDNLNALKPYAYTNIHKLPNEGNELLNSIIMTTTLLQGSPALYDLVLDDVNQIYGNIQPIEPGTVGSYFMGCMKQSNFHAGIGCDPKCAGSLLPSEKNTEYKQCVDTVSFYDGTEFRSLGGKQSSHAIIYHKQENFQGFTPEQIEQLRQSGITQVTLVTGNQENGYSQVMTKPLEQLEINNMNNSSSMNNWWYDNWIGIVIGIIIVIFIILLLFFFLSRRN